MEIFEGGKAMAEKELPLYGLKCPTCGLGMLSWSKEHVSELLALHQAEHCEPFHTISRGVRVPLVSRQA